MTTFNLERNPSEEVDLAIYEQLTTYDNDNSIPSVKGRNYPNFIRLV